MHLAGSSAASQAGPGVLGFLVVAGMGVVLFFLFRSMTKHLRKVAVDPRQDPVAASSTPASSTPANGTAPGRVATGGSVSDGLANDGGLVNGGGSGADS
jgi:hypothetical protein